MVFLPSSLPFHFCVCVNIVVRAVNRPLFKHTEKTEWFDVSWYHSLEWGKRAQKDKQQQQHCSNTKLCYLSSIITICYLNMKSMGTRLTAQTESSGLPSGDCFLILSRMGALFFTKPVPWIWYQNWITNNTRVRVRLQYM
jgi:hypothetical protein